MAMDSVQHQEQELREATPEETDAEQIMADPGLFGMLHQCDVIRSDHFSDKSPMCVS